MTPSEGDGFADWVTDRSRHGGVDELPLPFGPGRLYLAGKHFIGPDPERALRAVGAQQVVCLCEIHEIEDRFPSYASWLRSGRALWWPVSDLSAPTLDQAITQLSVLAQLLQEGESVVLHCGAGIGRAGTMAAALLVSSGMGLDDALEIVATARPMAGPERGAQYDFLVAFEKSKDLVGFHDGDRLNGDGF